MDGTSSGRDAIALGSLLAGLTAGELMLIAVHQEPVAEVVLPRGLNWTTRQKEARAAAVQARDALAPDARIAVQSDVLVWRGLRHVVRLEHRDLLVVGSARDAADGQVRLGKSAGELQAHLECPLAVAPSGMQHGQQPRLARVGVGFDGEPESRAAVALAGAIAVASGAELVVRGVVCDRVPGNLRIEETTLDGNAIVAKQLTSLAAAAMDAAGATGARTKVDVTAGSPTPALGKFRDEVDLLVIGSGHSAPAGRVELGGTGRAVLDDASCPVVIAPRPVAGGRAARSEP